MLFGVSRRTGGGRVDDCSAPSQPRLSTVVGQPGAVGIWRECLEDRIRSVSVVADRHGSGIRTRAGYQRRCSTAHRFAGGRTQSYLCTFPRHPAAVPPSRRSPAAAASERGPSACRCQRCTLAKGANRWATRAGGHEVSVGRQQVARRPACCAWPLHAYQAVHRRVEMRIYETQIPSLPARRHRIANVLDVVSIIRRVPDDAAPPGPSRWGAVPARAWDVLL